MKERLLADRIEEIRIFISLFQEAIMYHLEKDKRYEGIFIGLEFAILFFIISLLVNLVIKGTLWFVFSSVLRFAFGVWILIVARKVYGKTVKDIINFRGSKVALFAGIGFIVYFFYYLFAACLGVKAVTGLSAGLLFAQIFLQQLTTGFYEELNFRFLMVEGYFYGEKNLRNKLFYCLLNFVIFGAIHLIGGNMSSFFATGAIGFVYAVMYIKSRNILIPMIFHFVYDILANLMGYAEWRNTKVFETVNYFFIWVFVAMVIFSFFILIKKDEKKVDYSTSMADII